MEKQLTIHNPEVARRYDFMMRSMRTLGDIALQMIEDRVVVARLKPDGTVVTNVDDRLNNTFIDMARTELPGDLVWGEEASNSEKNNLALADKRSLWIIDPIDGTKGFMRSYDAGRFSDNNSTIMVTQFMPGQTIPTMSGIYNPFQDQKRMISAHSGQTFYETDDALDPQVIRVDQCRAPRNMADVQRFEQTHWKVATPDLDDFQKLVPRARITNHQLFMGSVALGDVDVSVFPGPSNPHDVAPGALILHNAGGDVRTFANEPFEQVDWRRFPVNGTVGTVNPILGQEVVRTVMKSQRLTTA